MKKIHGHIAKISHSKSFKAFEYGYFKSKNKAKIWAKSQIKFLKSTGIRGPRYYRVEPKTFQLCPLCKSGFMEIGEGMCLRCEKIRMG